MHVSATTGDSIFEESLTRMAFIPHGTTINAQCLAPIFSTAGPPIILATDIIPFVIGTSNKLRFTSPATSNISTLRLPQNPKIIQSPRSTITQAIRAIQIPYCATPTQKKKKKGNITKTTVFSLSTKHPQPPNWVTETANIAGRLRRSDLGAERRRSPNCRPRPASRRGAQHSIFVPVRKKKNRLDPTLCQMPGSPPWRLQALPFLFRFRPAA